MWVFWDGGKKDYYYVFVFVFVFMLCQVVDELTGKNSKRKSNSKNGIGMTNIPSCETHVRWSKGRLMEKCQRDYS